MRGGAIAALLCSAASAAAAARAPRFNIVHILLDDFGWAEVGFHRSAAGAGAAGAGTGAGAGAGAGTAAGQQRQQQADVSTPVLDGLAAESLELRRFYVHKICSPTRCSLQSGRAPIHVNVVNVLPESTNPADPVGGYQGIPINITTMAQLLARGGYRTAAVGKWDVGMATPRHSPLARGYQSWLGYWHHSNDYWEQTEEVCSGRPVRDLWRINSTYNGPATELANDPGCTDKSQRAAKSGGRCVFEDAILTQEVLRVLHEQQPGAQPLFLFWAPHLVHMPLQVPRAELEKFSFIADPFRKRMHTMVHYLDREIGTVVSSMKQGELWQESLVVIHADNGGEIMGAGTCGGNNWPLRGGKFANWEGGIRVLAMVTGGALPSARRGQHESGLLAVWDWLPTYAALAGVDAADPVAAAAGLPPMDGVDAWPLISGEVGAVRNEIVIGDTSAIPPNGDGQAIVGGLIWQPTNSSTKLWKLLLGAVNKGQLIEMAVLTGPSWPNLTSHLVPLEHTRRCGRTAATGCLYELNSDPTEISTLAEAEPAVFAHMLRRVEALQAGVYSPDRGSTNLAACAKAEARGFYWGPFMD